MRDTNRFCTRFEVDHFAPDAEKQWAYQKARRDFALGLFDALYGKGGKVNTGYNVVRIDEQINEREYPDFEWTRHWTDEIVFSAEITAVQFRDVTMQYETYEPRLVFPSRRSFLQRVKDAANIFFTK